MNNELNREINLKSILAFTLPSIFMMVVMSLSWTESSYPVLLTPTHFPQSISFIR